MTKAIDEMKNDDDFVILSRGDNDYIQAMKAGDRYVLQYKDDKGLHEYGKHDGKAEYSTVMRCFLTFSSGGPAWSMTRDQYEWKDAEN